MYYLIYPIYAFLFYKTLFVATITLRIQHAYRYNDSN